MANATEKIADIFTRHSVDIMRVDADIRRKIIRMLNGLSVELKDAIRNVDPSAPARIVYKNARLGTLTSIADEKVNAVYKNIIASFEKDLLELAGIEVAQVTGTVNRVLTVSLLQPVTDTATLRALVDGTLIEGATSKEWWKLQSRSLKELFQREMREGVIAGESIQTLTNRVIGTPLGSAVAGTRARSGGIMKTIKRRSEALVRTSVQAVTNEARYRTYQNNSDVIKGQQWLSTLDQRTSDICASLDGSSWDLDGNPINDTSSPFVGPPPAHYNCRSVLIPVVKEWSELNKNPKIQRKIEAYEKRNKKVTAPTRASIDGQVSGKLNYEEWLANKEKQGSNIPLQVLGPARHELWKAGKLKFSDLIDQSWNPLSVADLKAKIARRGL